MALVLEDRVKVRSRSTGTGTITLENPVTGYQSFAVIGDGNDTYYGIVDARGNWEIGQGTYTHIGTTLSRNTVLSSSNSGNLVNFPAGSKNVYCTFPSSVLESYSGGGTSYDQSLNTTDSVIFAQVEPGSLNQNSSITVSPNSVNVPGATSTVVFSANGALTSIKLVIVVEGRLDGDGTNVDHSQTCEATIAATYNTAAEPIISVYGIVYTSPAPLATFTVARNGLSGNIEVTAVNSQTTNAMNVRVHAIQFVSRYD